MKKGKRKELMFSSIEKVEKIGMQKFNFPINITKVELELREGIDRVRVFTDLPPPYQCTKALSFEFLVEKGTGIEYLKNVFGVKPVIRDSRPVKYFMKDRRK